MALVLAAFYFHTAISFSTVLKLFMADLIVASSRALLLRAAAFFWLLAIAALFAYTAVYLLASDTAFFSLLIKCLTYFIS